MPPDMTACTIDSRTRLSAPTCSSQATTATIQPIADHRERNRPAVLPSGCRTRIRGASTAPRCLSRKTRLVASAETSARSSPRIMRADGPKPPLTAATTAVPVAGSVSDAAAPTMPRIDRRDAPRMGGAFS